MYSLNIHAVQQADLKGISIERVLDAANNPSITYPNGRYPGQVRHIKNGVVAVVDPRTQRVITIYADRVETPLRADQTDSDAIAYGAKTHSRVPLA